MIASAAPWRDERGAPVFQEYPHHDDGEDGALDQHLERVVVRIADIADGGIELGELHVRIALAQLRHRLLRAFGHFERAFAPRAHHLEADHALAVQLRELADFRRLVADVGDGIEPHAAAVGERNGQRRQLLRGSDGADGAQVLLLPADARLATRQLACVRTSWRDTSPAVTPSEPMRSGSRSTRTSRDTPPMRLTVPTPFTAGDLAQYREIDEPRQLRVPSCCPS